MNTSISRVLIIGITPLILEKGLVWFGKNQRRIEGAVKRPSFWQRNTIVLEKNQSVIMSELLRKLTDFGYQKYQRVELPGEFSQIGGTITIFPINAPKAFRVEFLGNAIEEINQTDIAIKNLKPTPSSDGVPGQITWQTPLKKIIYTEKGRRREIYSDLSNLKKGDYIVHLDHGIGRFLQKECQMSNVTKSDLVKCQMFVLEYASGDKLHVPEAVAHKLSPYIGFSTPTIYRLGGNLWHRTKRKVKADIIKTAKELLRLYAKREVAKRQPYSPQDDMQSQIAQDFEFEETPDQQIAIEKITQDMEKDVPMDRLVCGDVGFGKTEVAIRAAAKAAISGRQTALVAPTTVLAWQHLKTFEARFKKLPITVVLLSRIQKRGEQKNIIEKLKRGEVDIVIGTHRILQRDVEFKNLGLLILDEEQRFGVKQKEKLKKMRAQLDVLSLSATPIPRTLYFSLSGLKNISNIQTAPAGRHPIKTFVLERSKKIIREAIARELARGGQVYYLHNRIATIDAALRRVQELARLAGASAKRAGENARVALGHAKLPDKQLIQIIEDFRSRKTDVLVATTIIENGLDLSNVNTLIVEDASRLGLSQAHQIRGRIGRGNTQAFAYFLYSKKKLTDIGKRRLQTLKSYQGLGQGYEIALQDLEIRGAGNLLGREQHGSINKIGLNLYCQMLNEAVEEMKSAH